MQGNRVRGFPHLQLKLIRPYTNKLKHILLIKQDVHEEYYRGPFYRIKVMVPALFSTFPLK